MARSLIATVACIALLGSPPTSLRARSLLAQSRAREFTIRARRGGFDPARIEVARGDMVKITLVAEDTAHSFTIDSYRISKRASPRQSVIIEFHADVAGTFPFYCSLTLDDCCRNMRGDLVVR
jgi:heme/copper-type cytochrome/quinol oxidase subunit 2